MWKSDKYVVTARDLALVRKHAQLLSKPDRDFLWIIGEKNHGQLNSNEQERLRQVYVDSKEVLDRAEDDWTKAREQEAKDATECPSPVSVAPSPTHSDHADVLSIESGTNGTVEPATIEPAQDMGNQKSISEAQADAGV